MTIRNRAANFRIEKMKRIGRIVSLLGLCILVGCSPATATPPTATAEPETLTATVHVPPTQTETPTALLPTATPTSQPKPTINLDGADKGLELMTTNGGCELPCWWGITPGETTWETASDFLDDFVVQIWENNPTTIVEDGQVKELLVYSVDFIIQGELVAYGQPGAMYAKYSVYDGLVHTIQTPSFGSQDKYLLPNMLALLGNPDEALIEITDVPVAPEKIISLVVFFADSGVTAEYHAYVDNSTEDYLKACFMPEPALSLQAPSDPRTLKDFWQGRYYNEYVPLEEVIDVSLDELYINLQQSSEPCFEIVNPDV